VRTSPFGRSGVRRIVSTSSGVAGLESVAFRNADDGSKALIVVNTETQDRAFTLVWDNQSFRYSLPAGAVATFVWS
jgi:glucosylceramidase